MVKQTGINQLELAQLHKHIDIFRKQYPQINIAFQTIGYPKLYTRPAGFETLVKIILGQQVSLASALSAYLKLKDKVKKVTPVTLFSLSDEELKQCYFSRQKVIYVKALCNAIIKKELNLKQLVYLDDTAVINELTKVKGIGIWTAEIYLLQALKRCDIFPKGDLAAINGLKDMFNINDTEKLWCRVEPFKPYRSSLLFFVWHYYAHKKKLKIVL
jgi:DNA-3-methyladenine glycosylase II